MQHSTPACFRCSRFHFSNIETNTCDSFPDGIPQIIFPFGDEHLTSIDGEPTFRLLPEDEAMERIEERRQLIGKMRTI